MALTSDFASAGGKLIQAFFGPSQRIDPENLDKIPLPEELLGAFQIKADSPAQMWDIKAEINIKKNLGVENSGNAMVSGEIGNDNEVHAKKEKERSQTYLWHTLSRMDQMRRLKESLAGMADHLDQKLGKIENYLSKLIEKRKGLNNLEDFFSRNPQLVLQEIEQGDYKRLMDSGATEEEIETIKAQPDDDSKILQIQGWIDEKQKEINDHEVEVNSYRDQVKDWYEIINQEEQNFDGSIQNPKFREFIENMGLNPDDLKPKEIDTIRIELEKTLRKDDPTINNTILPEQISPPSEPKPAENLPDPPSADLPPLPGAGS